MYLEGLGFHSIGRLGKEMNALMGNKAVLLISHSIDINALTGNAQNHAA
jgi:hypothetical protein